MAVVGSRSYKSVIIGANSKEQCFKNQFRYRITHFPEQCVLDTPQGLINIVFLKIIICIFIDRSNIFQYIACLSSTESVATDFF
jgi:hypothetical protein